MKILIRHSNCDETKRINRNSSLFGRFRMFWPRFIDLQNFILLVRTVSLFRKIIFISSYTDRNNFFLLYELIQDLPYAAPNKGTTILYWFRSLSTVLSLQKIVVFKDFSKLLSDFPVLFKADLIFKDFQESPLNSSTFQALRTLYNHFFFQNRVEKESLCLVWFDSLPLSQQLWSCRDGQFT